MDVGERMKVELEWISTNNKLPSKNGSYLVATDDHGETITADYRDGKWFYRNMRPEIEIMCNITYWAHKPKVPTPY